MMKYERSFVIHHILVMYTGYTFMLNPYIPCAFFGSFFLGLIELTNVPLNTIEFCEKVLIGHCQLPKTSNIRFVYFNVKYGYHFSFKKFEINCTLKAQELD